MKISRIIKWSALNAAFWILAWQATHGMKGAGNILIVLCWVHLLMVVLVFSNKNLSLQIPPTVIPAWLSYPISYGLTGFLIWHGWFFTALALLLADIMTGAIYHRIKTQPPPSE
jgi:hypothetical protein